MKESKGVSEMRVASAFLIAAVAGAPACAEELRDFCADRPGLAVPACVVDKGHLQAEIGLGDWTHDKQPDSVTNTMATGDVALRLGVTNSTEFRFEWTAYTHVRAKDRASGMVDRVAGVGDVTLGVKQSLLNPAGDKLSIALLPFGTIPTGKEGIGAGTWGAGLVIPVNYALTKSLTLELTPEADAAPNADEHGRHLAYSGTIGVEAKLSEQLSTGLELQATRDREPGEHKTEMLAAVSLAFQPGKNSQFDLQANVSVNHNSSDLELLFGVSERF